MSSPVLVRGEALRAGDRWLVVVCLLVTAGTHLPLVPGHLREARYLGVAFALLVLAGVGLAVAVALRDTGVVWASVALVDVLALSAYVLSRTVGLPLVTDDRGHWLEPLSFPALAAELVSLAVTWSVLAHRTGTADPLPSSG